MTSIRNDEARARVGLSLLAEPGDSVLGTLVAAYGAAKTVELTHREHAPPEVDGRVWAGARARWGPRQSALRSNDQAERARQAGAELIIPGDDAWPDAVNDLGAHAPLLLWVRGGSGVLTGTPSVAIVGARAATSYGEYVAGDLAGAVARTGAVVISGGAYGIDGAAHRAALGVGGATIAVMAGGVDRPYPAGHASLIAQITRSGAVISEVPLGVTPTRWRFLSRNRNIAAMADAVVVVEAGWRSGSLNTAGHAATLGRPLGAVPGPVTSAASAGCHRLLREFDAVCVTTPDEIRELAGWSTEATRGAGHLRGSDGSDGADGADGHAGSSANRVIDALSVRVVRDVDQLARRSGASRDEVLSALGHLVLEGIASASADGYILRQIPASSQTPTVGVSRR